MPTPTSLPDLVGPIQICPIDEAIAQAYDVSIDCIWIYSERLKQLIPFSITPGWTINPRYHYLGIRIIYKQGYIYSALAIDTLKDDPIKAYDRAMAIVKR